MSEIETDADRTRTTAWRTAVFLAAGDEAELLGAERGSPVLARPCWHESGHCLIALLQGKQVTEVIARRDGSGHCQIGELDPENEACYQRSDSEKRAATNVVLAMAGDEPIDENIVRWRARELLEANWAAVEAIARALHNRLAAGGDEASLSGDEAQVLFELYRQPEKGE